MRAIGWDHRLACVGGLDPFGRLRLLITALLALLGLLYLAPFRPATFVVAVRMQLVTRLAMVVTMTLALSNPILLLFFFLHFFFLLLLTV